MAQYWLRGNRVPSRSWGEDPKIAVVYALGACQMDTGIRARKLERIFQALRDDRSRTKLLHMSELGLVELTRKRSRRGLEARLMRACPTCAGHGRVKSPRAVAAEALAELRRMLPLLDGQRVTLRAVPEVAREIELALHGPAAGPERTAGPRVQVVHDPAMRPDHFDLLAGR